MQRTKKKAHEYFYEAAIQNHEEANEQLKWMKQNIETQSRKKKTEKYSIIEATSKFEEIIHKLGFGLFIFIPIELTKYKISLKKIKYKNKKNK